MRLIRPQRKQVVCARRTPKAEAKFTRPVCNGRLAQLADRPAASGEGPPLDRIVVERPLSNPKVTSPPLVPSWRARPRLHHFGQPSTEARRDTDAARHKGAQRMRDQRREVPCAQFGGPRPREAKAQPLCSRRLALRMLLAPPRGSCQPGALDTTCRPHLAVRTQFLSDQSDRSAMCHTRRVFASNQPS
jgi:endogenous inhibitor of DNA gyrase (YacG/DUF329 family)